MTIVSAMDMTNSGKYASLMTQYGSKEESSAVVLMSIESGPPMTMVILGSAAIASFSPHHFLGVVLPFLVSFAIGNLGHELRAFFAKATGTLLPFFGFELGNTIKLGVILDTGLLGILLGVCVIVITAIPLILADKFLAGGNGTAGVAASSTAGAAVANPVIIAQTNPGFAPVAQSATALVATCVIVTAMLVPILTALYHRHVAGSPVHQVADDNVPASQMGERISLLTPSRGEPWWRPLMATSPAQERCQSAG